MTAVPAPDGQSLSLVCDFCGACVRDICCAMGQWSVVWAVVSRTGWSGSPLSTGLHACPRCRSR